MHFNTVVALLLAVRVAEASPVGPMLQQHVQKVGKRDVTWGPIVGFGETSSEIISTTSTIYPGAMPHPQKGYLFSWIGVGVNGDGYDLIQSIVGSYPAGQSECSGSNADTAWCISSEVYGLDSQGVTTQFVGDKRTADVNYKNGIVFDYKLDTSSYTWTQTTKDAVTGSQLSTYSKVSKQKSTLWNTAIELQDANGAAPSGTKEPQYWVNTTIVLKAKDANYGSTIYSEMGGTYTKPTTSDGGKTWFIEKITAPALA